MTTEIKIDGLECTISKNGLTNVVEKINWVYTLSENDKSYTINGAVNVPDPNPNEFRPFEELTNEIVLVWLTSMINFEEYNQSMLEQLTILNEDDNKVILYLQK